ncbi:MAG: Dabb family protein [Clostridia bacterium]|nr:Dabb family protein [Clostridia bacterium]
MIRHIVMWKLKEGIDREQTAREIKKQLEKLPGKIPGLLSLEVGIGKNPEDVVLISAHSDWEALKAYASHPLHVAAADTYVRPFTASRQAVDYETEA